MPSLRWQVYNKGVSALPSLRMQQRAIHKKASIQHSNQCHHSEGRCTRQSQHGRQLDSKCTTQIHQCCHPQGKCTRLHHKVIAVTQKASVKHRSINAVAHKASVQDVNLKDKFITPVTQNPVYNTDLLMLSPTRQVYKTLKTNSSLLSLRTQVYNTDLLMPSPTRQVYKTSRQSHYCCHLESKCTTQIYQRCHPQGKCTRLQDKVITAITQKASVRHRSVNAATHTASVLKSHQCNQSQSCVFKTNSKQLLSITMATQYKTQPSML